MATAATGRQTRRGQILLGNPVCLKRIFSTTSRICAGRAWRLPAIPAGGRRVLFPVLALSMLAHVELVTSSDTGSHPPQAGS